MANSLAVTAQYIIAQQFNITAQQYITVVYVKPLTMHIIQ